MRSAAASSKGRASACSRSDPVMAAWAILTFRASVLYTFYPPLQAHPAFYIGLTLVVVASWGWAVSMIASWQESRRRNRPAPTSLAMHATLARWFVLAELERPFDQIRSDCERAIAMFEATGDDRGLARAWLLIADIG